MSLLSRQQTMSVITSEFIIETIQLSAKAGIHNKVLNGIMAGESPDSEKIKQIKHSILKYNSTWTEELIVDENVKQQAKLYDELMKNIPKNSQDAVHAADMIHIMMKPNKEHREMLNKISNVLRNKDLDDEKKVDEIGDILL